MKIIAAVLLATIVFATSARGASDDEDSWSTLVDEPSRQEIFKNEVKTADLQSDHGRATKTLAIPKVFYFPDDAFYDSIEKNDRINSKFGIDVSHYTGAIRFDKLKIQGVDFVYIKATQGSRYKDSNFARFWQEAAASGVDRGAYHFISSEDDGAVQCSRFVAYVRLHGGFDNALAPVVDLEWDRTKTNPDRWVGHSAQSIIDNVKACLKTIEEQTGLKPIIYTATSWFSNRTIPLNRFNELGDYPIWIADYNNARKLSEKPKLPRGRLATLWQFTDGAFLTTGYDRGVDANIFYGSDADYAQAFHKRRGP